MTRYEDLPEFVRNMPEIDLPFSGCRGFLLQGEKEQVTFLEFDEDTDVPEHTHDDQWEFTLAGKVNLTVAGVEKEFEAGGNFFIPAGVPHSAKVFAGYKALIVFNSPDRYKKK